MDDPNEYVGSVLRCGAIAQCSNIHTMVEDFTMDLSGFDVSFRDRASVGSSGQHALADGVRLHSEIIE